MSITISVGNDSLRAAVEIAAAISSLPAVATQDWCMRAAAALRLLRPRAVASVALASMGARGLVLTLEAVGVSGADPLGRPLEHDALHGEHTTGFDWWIPTDQQGSAGAAALMRELPCREAWAESRSARRWAALGATDLVVGLVSLPGETSNRSIVVEVGTDGTPPVDATTVGVIQASLPLLARRASFAFGQETSTAGTRLTSREQQVLEHLALGKSVKQIAADLARSPHTVHDHVKSLHRKLHASSRGELIARALGHLAPGGSQPAHFNGRVVEFNPRLGGGAPHLTARA